nr:immunoglobulin light chain junction region [Macaca mulatta]
DYYCQSYDTSTYVF